MGSGASEMGDPELVEALCDIEDGLWSRELEFVDDVGKRLKRMTEAGNRGAFTLSPRQRAWAEDIWRQKG